MKLSKKEFYAAVVRCIKTCTFQILLAIVYPRILLKLWEVNVIAIFKNCTTFLTHKQYPLCHCRKIGKDRELQKKGSKNHLYL